MRELPERGLIHLYYFLHECRPTEADLLVLFSPERCATPSGDQADLFSIIRSIKSALRHPPYWGAT